MPFAPINELEIYYEIHGSGPPIVLISGLASDSQSWNPIINDLAKNNTIITFDNRGAGRTKPQETYTSIELISSDCVELIKKLGYSKVVLLGHSMGGFIALNCAIRYSQFVDKLILAGTSAYNFARNNALLHDWASYLEAGMESEKWFRNVFYWIFTQDYFENEKNLQQALDLALDYPYSQSCQAFQNQVNAIAEFNCTLNITKITAETLVITGEKDLLFPPETSFKILNKIPNSTFSIMENAAHALYLERPGEFVDSILRFINNS